jgi:hypothetical protein
MKIRVIRLVKMVWVESCTARLGRIVGKTQGAKYAANHRNRSCHAARWRLGCDNSQGRHELWACRGPGQRPLLPENDKYRSRVLRILDRVPEAGVVVRSGEHNNGASPSHQAYRERRKGRAIGVIAWTLRGSLLGGLETTAAPWAAVVQFLQAAGGKFCENSVYVETELAGLIEFPTAQIPARSRAGSLSRRRGRRLRRQDRPSCVSQCRVHKANPPASG